jgi:hypothetical protein
VRYKIAELEGLVPRNRHRLKNVDPMPAQSSLPVLEIVNLVGEMGLGAVAINPFFCS